MKTCAVCGKQIPKSIGPNYYRQKFCGRDCYAKSLSARARAFAVSPKFAEKFWSKVDKRGPDECWPWVGTFNDNGYGQIGGSPFSKRQGRKDYAHRVAYCLTNGEIQDDPVVRHSCDNRECTNPKHLLIGTTADNSADAVERDRVRHGERHPCAKLTADAVKKILGSDEPHTVLAARLGVHDATILRVRKRETWRRVA